MEREAKGESERDDDNEEEIEGGGNKDDEEDVTADFLSESLCVLEAEAGRGLTSTLASGGPSRGELN